MMYKKLYPLLLIGCVGNTDVFTDPSNHEPDAGESIVDAASDCALDVQSSSKDASVIVDAQLEDVVLPSIDSSTLDAGCTDASDASQDLDAADAGSVLVDSGFDASDPTDPHVDPPKTYVEYDINHILSTGQSNSVANGGSPYLTTSQPYNNIMFNTGVMTARNCGGQVCSTYEVPSSFIPLREGDMFFDYPVETMSSAMANQITNLEPNHVSLVSLHGRSGNVYGCLRQNSCGWFPATNNKPFEEGIRQVTDGQRLAQAAGKTYIVRAVTSVHGESDSYNNIFPQLPIYGGVCAAKYGLNSIDNYRDALLEWQCSYDTEIKKVTHQLDDVPLMISQLSGQNKYAYSDVAARQYQAHKDSNGKVVLVTPTYFLKFRDDCLHFNAIGQQILGEYFAEAYYTTVVEGKKYEPLRPRRVYFDGANRIIVEYLNQYPLTTDMVTVATQDSLGFEVYQDGSKIDIYEVEVQNNRVVLTAPAAGTNVEVRYALAQTPGSCIGPMRGARGNIRDTNPKVSLTGNHLYNWSVQFAERVLN